MGSPLVLKDSARPPMRLAMESPRDGKPHLGAMLGFGGDRPDHKRVSFRVMGADLDPDRITQATALSPDVAHRRGEPTGHERPSHRREGLWSLCSSPPLPEGGNHLEDHLRWLLDLLLPHAGVLRRICEEDGLRVDFSCGYFMGQANSGFGISPRTLAGIAALGAELGIDIYGEDVEVELEHWLHHADPRS
jgi:Domain of unknown function (DUF4279)